MATVFVIVIVLTVLLILGGSGIAAAFRASVAVLALAALWSMLA